MEDDFIDETPTPYSESDLARDVKRLARPGEIARIDGCTLPSDRISDPILRKGFTDKPYESRTFLSRKALGDIAELERIFKL